MKTLQHEKVQLEIVLYMKRIQNENRTIRRKCNLEKVKHKKVKSGNGAA